jgi:hypothetical protein
MMVFLLIVGCAGQKAPSAYKPAGTEYQESTSETSEQATTKTVSSAAKKSADADEDNSAPAEARVLETDDGTPLTLQKSPDYRRTRAGAEKCDLAFPLECSKFLAKDGVVYVTVKNVGYSSKIDEVVLSLDGEDCDPTESYIETGNIKQFDCYTSAKATELVSGSLEISYHSPIEQKNFIKTGSVVVMME